MNFSDALLDIIISSEKSAISRQELYKEFINIWDKKEYKNIKISDIRYNSKYYKRKFKSVLRELETSDKLKCIGDDVLGASYFINLTINPLNALKVISDLYPLGYFSHLSAMQIHKLINKEHDVLYFSTVDRKTWKNKFLDSLPKENYQLFKDDYDKEIKDLIPRFPTEENYISKYLLVFTNKKIIDSESVDNIPVRKLSFLFLDMVKSPQYCGGIETVINVFQKYSSILLEEILEVAEKYGTNMDRARIGFILDELLGVKHNLIEKWKLEMIGLRGGSRKFIPYLPFDPEFTPTWNISLNHDSVKNYFYGVTIKNISEINISNRAYFETKFAYIHSFIEHKKVSKNNSLDLLIHNLNLDDVRELHPNGFPYSGDRIYLKNETEIELFLERFKIRFEQKGFNIQRTESRTFQSYKYWQFQISWSDQKISLLNTDLDALDFLWTTDFIKAYLISRGVTFI
jgi:predicted transcriptional regulator of viral defense system